MREGDVRGGRLGRAALLAWLIGGGMLVSAGVTRPLPAQRTEAVDVGDRVRISLAPSGRRKITGMVDSLLPSAFVVDTVGQPRRRFMMDPGPAVLEEYRRTTVRFTDIERMELSAGVSKTRGALRYGLIAAGVGAVLGGAGASSQVNPSGKEFASGAASGGLIGLGIGAVIGWFIGREQWSTVATPSPRSSSLTTPR
jgi:hypothetical protein